MRIDKDTEGIGSVDFGTLVTINFSQYFGSKMNNNYGVVEHIILDERNNNFIVEIGMDLDQIPRKIQNSLKSGMILGRAEIIIRRQRLIHMFLD